MYIYVFIHIINTYQYIYIVKKSSTFTTCLSEGITPRGLSLPKTLRSLLSDLAPVIGRPSRSDPRHIAGKEDNCHASISRTCSRKLTIC